MEERLQSSELVHRVCERSQHSKCRQHEHLSLRVSAWHNLGHRQQRLHQLLAEQLQVELRELGLYRLLRESANTIVRRDVKRTVRVPAWHLL